MKENNQFHTQRKEEREKKQLFAAILLLVVGCICVAVWALLFQESESSLAPDRAPQETEANQSPIEGDDGDKMEAEEGGGAVSMMYSSYVTIDLSDELAILMFANPNKSVQDMLVQIVIRGEVLAQSGRLTPGNKVTALNLLDGASKKLSVGGYDGKFVISYYDTTTGEKSIVNTEIPVSISVIE